MLAQASCPGWMVLASEGESALRPLPPVVPDDVEPTVHRVSAEVPVVKYPNPIRVANRLLLNAPTVGEENAADDPDDLLDGVPDLLADPNEEVESPSVEQPSVEAPPQQDSPVEKPQVSEPAAKTPAKDSLVVEPSTIQSPTVEEPAQEEPAIQTPIEQSVEEAAPSTQQTLPQPEPKPQPKPALQPPPPLPPKGVPKRKPAPIAVPQVTAPIVVPKLTEPEPTKQAPESLESLPPPATPVKTAPKQETPESEPWPKPAPKTKTSPTPTEVPISSPFAPPPAPSSKPAAPVEQPEPIVTPKPTVPSQTTTPPRQQPAQSPFAAPPKPVMPTPHSVGSAGTETNEDKDSDEPQTYCEFVAEQQYPSAHVCAKCHQKIFDEWSVSSHAYAAISPMFHKFEQTINALSQGTVGYFCYRCHVPVGTTLGASRATPLWDLPQVAREGVTCIACHRVNQRYGKVNGHRRIEPGSIYDPVYGSIGGDGIAQVIAEKNKYKVKTSPHDKGPGQDIHVVGQRFDQLGKSEFCVSCHQVAVHPGIKLEVVWEQYRASPACKKGVSCQDCHMGRIPGVKSGYEYGAAAEVNGKVVNKNRKHANHVFYGPGYSIAHPGIFPHNADALRWNMQEWLLFDWRAGWGTDEFEELVDDGRIHVNFPKVWEEADDRYDAREIIEDNQKKLDYKRISRQQTMENGSHVDGPFFDSQLMRGQELKFHYIMTNTNEGHNLPSGSLGAQPQLWANVVLIGPRGQRLWESGYTDRYGDVADIHSEDVRNKLLPFDWQLFNLQTMFLITGAKGTDREFFLPVNFDIDQIPYLRPGAQPITVLNHPPFIRMEGRSLAPLGSRKIPYKVPAELMCEPGHYRISFRLRSRAEPIYFMRFCGSTEEMNRAMNEGMIDFHQSSVEFIVR